MNSVDKRVVKLDFDNAGFEQKAADTLSALSSLEKGFKFKNASAGLDEVANKAGSFNLDPLLSAAESVNSRFSTMGIFASRIIENIADTAYRAGTRIASTLTAPVTKAVNQIKTGGWNRAANLEQAKFTMRNLGYEWQTYEDSINKGVAGTAYGLDQGALLASKLLSSGLKDTKELEMTLLAVAGTASTFSTDYERVGDIMQDCVSKGVAMGGEFQRLSEIGVPAAEILAEKWGVTSDEILEMASKRQISGLQLVAALFDKFGDSADKANETYTGALSNLNSGLSKIGEKLATPFREHMRDLFNVLRVAVNTIKSIIDPITDVVNEKIGSVFDWLLDKLGGTDETELKETWSKLDTAIHNVADALSNLWDAAVSFVTPIANALKSVFPPATILDLNRGTKSIADLTKKLKLSDQATAGLQDVFTAIFSIIKKIVSAIKKIWGYLKPIRTLLFNATSALAKLLHNIAKFYNSSGLAGLINILKDAFSSLWSNLKDAGSKFKDFVDNTPILKSAKEHMADFVTSVTKLTQNLPSLNTISTTVFNSLNKVVTILSKLTKTIFGDSFNTLYKDIKSGFSQVVDYINGDSSKINIAQIFSTIITDILAVINAAVTAATKLLSSIWNWIVNLNIDYEAIATTAMEFAKGFVDGISTAIGMFTVDFSPLIDSIKNNPIVKTIGNFINSIVQSITGSGQKAKKQNDEITESGTEMTASVEQLAEDANTSYGYLTNILNLIGGAKDSAMTVFVAAAANVAWQFSRIVKNIAEALDGIGQIFKSIAKQNRAIARNINANAILKIAISIGIIAASIYALSSAKIDENRLRSVFIGLTILVGIFAILMIALKRAGTAGRGLAAIVTKIKHAITTVSRFTKFGLLIAGIGAGLFLIVRTMIELNNMDFGSGIAGLAVIALMLSGLVFVAKMLNKYAAHMTTGTALSVVAMAAAVYILTFAVSKLSKLVNVNNGIKGYSKLAAGVAAICVLLYALSKAAKQAGRYGLTKLGPSMLKIAAALWVISIAVKSLGKLSLPTLAKGIISVIVLLAAFTGAAWVLSKTNTNAIASLGSLAVGILAITAAFWVMGQAIANIVHTFESTTSGIDNLGWVAAGILAFVAIMAFISNSLDATKTLNFIQFSAALVILAAAIAIITAAVLAANSVPWDKFLESIGLVAVAIVAFGIATWLLNAIAGKAIASLGAELLPFAASCLMIAGAVWLVVDALETLLTSPAFEGLRTLIGDLIEDFKSLATQAKEAWEWIFGGEGTEAWENRNESNYATINAYLDAQAKVDKGLLDENNDLFKSLKDQAEAAAKDLGFYSLEGYLQAINGGYGDVYESGEGMGEKFLAGVDEALDIHSPSGETKDRGDNVINSFTGTIASYADKMFNSGLETATNWLNGFISEEAGAKDAGSGMISEVVSGLISGKANLNDAAQTIANDAVNAYGDSFSLTDITGEELKNVISDLYSGSIDFNTIMEELGSDAAISQLTGYYNAHVGENMVQSTANEAVANASRLSDSYRQVSNEAANAISEGFEAGEPWPTDVAVEDVMKYSDGIIDGTNGSYFSNALSNMGNTAASYMSSFEGDFMVAGEEMVDKYIKGASSKELLEKVDITFGQVAHQAVDGLWKYEDNFTKTGERMVGNYITGANSDKTLEKVDVGYGTVAHEAVDGLLAFDGNFTKTGENAAIGFSNGAVSKIAVIRTAFESIAQNALDAMNHVLGIASPAKALIRVGKYTMEGFGIGLSKNADQAIMAADNVATGVLSALGTISADGALSLNPVITPIVDLSNVQNGADSINGMFTNTALGVDSVQANLISGNINGLSSIANAFTASRINNDDVVNAISNLNDEINSMANKMTTLQVRMDSGALVGSISGKMDMALGNIAKRKGRSG